MAYLFSRTVKKILFMAAATAVATTSLMATDASAQAFGQTKFQQGRDGGQYIPTIWVDPNGCDHWIIDDGFEGYLSARLDKYGKPVWSGVAEPTHTVGDFKAGSSIGDLI